MSVYESGFSKEKELVECTYIERFISRNWLMKLWRYGKSTIRWESLAAGTQEATAV